MLNLISNLAETVVTVAIIISFICLFYVISEGNKLAQLKVKVQESAAGIDVALSKRYGVLRKMFDVSKGYMNHETYVILESIKLRSGMPMLEKTRAVENMDAAVRTINAVGEAYPQFASSEVFVNLQKSISDTEEHLQAARRLYNSNVSMLNQKIVTFPTSVVARMRGITMLEMFIAEEAHRSDVNMDF